MEGESLNLGLRQLWRKGGFVCLAVFLFGFVAAAQSDEGFESAEPVLVSEAASTRAIAIDPAGWTGTLPTESKSENNVLEAQRHFERAERKEGEKEDEKYTCQPSYQTQKYCFKQELK